MGLSVHYKGQLKKPSSLKNLIDALADIAKTEMWNYFIFEEQFPNQSFSLISNSENLYGIMITPLECEPLCISFLKMGGCAEL